ncbi:helix-turn-helix domain-containing protein [Lacisediminihabitans profunda]|uniref:helix-turn-helix domain-containing protein n=1 Tax=Lacisediminihabitans profunda TaxID=2594790 RepID=UPI003CCC5B53
MTSVVVEGRRKVDVARDYGVSYRWVHTLVSRYLTGGWDAIEPQSRRPKTSPTRTPPDREAEIIQLRKSLQTAGHDAGPHTIAAHLERRHGSSPAVSTIWKVLRRNGLVTEQPKKRPRSSYLRFEADLPNETWQSDFTHWRLASGTGTEVLTFLDDHSRKALSITAYPVVTVAHVLQQFRATVTEYGPPASTLTDNGLVFTTRVRGGRNTFENELNLLGIDQKNGRPNHPQTQGKVERFQLNRPGVDGGSDSAKDDDYASTEEVPAGVAGEGHSARAGSPSAGWGPVAQPGSAPDRAAGRGQPGHAARLVQTGRYRRG